MYVFQNKPKKKIYFIYIQVDEQGQFHRLGDPRLLYGAMLAIRVNLGAYFSFLLARAVTIAVRYSAIRRQGTNPNG